MGKDIQLWELKQESRDYIAKCDAEHGTGGLTVDIKERIDGLTEAEAKAALEWILKYATDITRCNSCPFKTGKSGCPEIGMCRNHFLAEALKEAQHERQ